MGSEFNSFSSAYNEFEKALIANAQPKLDLVINKSAAEFLRVLVTKIEMIYRESVDMFYSSYDPDFYQRTLSFYRRFKGGSIKGRSADISISVPDGLPDYLFRISMVRGYHGGADSGPLHPSPGTPYYRTPYPPEGKGVYVNKDGVARINGFYNWGKPAATAPFSPLEDYNDRVRNLVEGEEASKIFQGIFEKYVHKIF